MDLSPRSSLSSFSPLSFASSDTADGKPTKVFLENLFAAKSDRVNLKVVNNKSAVWVDFSRVQLDKEDVEFVACNKCQILITHNKKSDTSGMRQHRCDRIREIESPARQLRLENYVTRKPSEAAKTIIVEERAFEHTDGRDLFFDRGCVSTIPGNRQPSLKLIVKLPMVSKSQEAEKCYREVVNFDQEMTKNDKERSKERQVEIF